MITTIQFAKRELAKYQKLVTGRDKHSIELKTDASLGEKMYEIGRAHV